MKKLLSLIVTLVMIFGLAACGGETLPEIAETTGQDASGIAEQTEPVIEFITEPVKVKFVAGYAEDGAGDVDYLYETFELTSVTLCPAGATVVGFAGMNTPDMTIQVFLKDGGYITLTGNSGGPNAEDLPESKLVANTIIDLEQVSYLVFPDGTQLHLPE